MRKIIYTINAIHYSLYLMSCNSQMQMHEFVQDVLHFFFMCIGLEEDYNTRMKDRYENNNDLKKYMYGEKAGQSIGMAHHIFGFIYSGYSSVLSCILLGLIERYWRCGNGLVTYAVIGIIVFLWYIPAYKALYTNDRYLSYFKKFKKKNDKWHRKWRWITITFCIGDFIMIGLGVLFMCMI